MSNHRNRDPFAPWNSAMYEFDPFAPHNNPTRYDPFAPWNQIFYDERDLSDSDAKYYGINRRRRDNEDED